MNPGLLDAAREMPSISQLSTCPTQGVSLVEFRQSRLRWRVWDLSGAGRFRPLWSKYLGHVEGVVFVVDVAGGDRVACARDELAALLERGGERGRRIPVLLFANKADLAGDAGEGEGGKGGGANKPLTVENVRMAFGVDNLNQYQKVKVFSSSGLTGAGVAEGFAWMSDMLKLMKRGESESV